MTSSSQPRKQRRFRYDAPLHLRHKFLHAHLSPELRQRYGTRSVRIAKGDKVRVMRGDAKGHEGKVLAVDLGSCKVTLEKLTVKKADGSEMPRPIDPSKLMILELNLDDKLRRAKLESKHQLRAKES